ncbi:hypothetical protein RYX36_031794 [Vicia faba]
MPNFIPGGRDGGRESVIKQLNAACSSLIAIGFREELFTLNNLHNYGYTETKFLELIQPIPFITDLRALRFLFNTARQSLYHLSVTPPPNEFCDFVNCINWIKSELSDRMQKEEISKVDIAIARKLVDSAAPLMKERKRFQSAIDELKKRQMMLETESARISGELKLKLGPIYEYEEPSIAELRIECYHLYEKDCRFRGIPFIPTLDDMECENLVAVFGGTAKERHFINFLNDPVRKELIETYFNGILFKG